MASTITLQTTTNYTGTFVRSQPLTGVGGITNEPALSAANTIKQFILSPPFAWRWNRNTASITTVLGTQDYSVALSDFGWLEKATSEANGVSKELSVSLVLADELTQARPINISTQNDDGAGNITFRLLPVPDAVYTIKIVYQKKATLFTALTGTWAPIPDEFAYMYNTGFRALMYDSVDIARAESERQFFISQVLAANEGLTDSQKNLFLSNGVRDQRQQGKGLI